MQDGATSGMAEETVTGCRNHVRTRRQKRSSSGLGEAGGSLGQGSVAASPYQFLRAEADEDPLGILAVMSALHEGQEELGSVVLGRSSPC